MSSRTIQPRFFPLLLPVLLAATALPFAGCASRVKVAEISPPLPNPEAQLERTRNLWQKISSGNRSDEIVDEYNETVARIVSHLDIPENGTESDRLTLKLRDTSIPVENRLSPLTNLPDLERIRVANHMVVKGVKEKIEADGVGAPLVLRFPPEGYSPQEGKFQPATALLKFDSGGSTPVLTLHDPLLPGANGGVPGGHLRGDFSAPLAARFDAEDRQRINILAMVRSDKFDGRLGMSLLDNVYPEKIPVVFIHGLKSAPNTWRDTMNELRADPVIRDRFEFWTFGYATGVPLPYSAMKLREALKGMATYRDLLGGKTDNIVLIGHSMGGLISRLMTESSGDEEWFQFFNEPVDELPIPEEKRELLRKMAYFEPLPFVKRVVFIATPHGGSQVADDAIGRIFSGLIALPNQLLVLSKDIFSESLYALTPFGRSILSNGLPTSIDQLESDSEMLQRLKAAPLKSDVSFHSIVGDRGLGPGPDCSDGVVPYTSAHLEGVESELIVPSHHRAHQHPKAIPELIRILRLHVGE